jgi:hypothetical protein
VAELLHNVQPPKYREHWWQWLRVPPPKIKKDKSVSSKDSPKQLASDDGSADAAATDGPVVERRRPWYSLPRCFGCGGVEPPASPAA